MDEDFIKTLQLKIIAGSGFTQTDVLQIDTTNNYKNFKYAFILNESAVRALGWTPQEAIGKHIEKGEQGIIKGVVKDFNFKSFHTTIGPLVLFLDHFQTAALYGIAPHYIYRFVIGRCYAFNPRHIKHLFF